MNVQKFRDNDDDDDDMDEDEDGDGDEGGYDGPRRKQQHDTRLRQAQAYKRNTKQESAQNKKKYSYPACLVN